MSDIYTVSQLLFLDSFTCSKIFSGKKLIGTFEIIKSDDIFPIGTIIFNDTTGRLACHFLEFQPRWISGTVLLTKWNYLLNKTTGNRISSNYLEVQEVQEVQELRTNSSLEYFPPQTSNKYLIGKVLIKSVLQYSNDKPVGCLLMLIDDQTHVHILFSGKEMIERYVMIIVGKTYLLTDLNMTNQISSIFPVFEFNPTFSNSFPINDKHSFDYLNPSNLFNNISIQSHSTNIIECSPIPFFTYKGTITCIIDNVLGVFILDSQYILHLGRYPYYNYLILPYRVGMTLLLHNVHAVSMKMDHDIWKLSARKHCPRLEDIKIIFVACFCSTIQICEFPSNKFCHYSITPRVISKFSLFHVDDSLTLLDLIWIQKVYYEILEKFPGEFDDSTLLGNPLGDYSSGRSSLLSQLFQRYRISDQYDQWQEWPLEFFNHRFGCRTCQSSDINKIKFITFSNFSKIIEKIENQSTTKVITQSEAEMKFIQLIGILEGNSNGMLQLRDHTGQIQAINISSVQKIQTYHLNNIWLVPEYEIVLENHQKPYIRFEIDKCFCFYVKPYPFLSELKSFIFRVSHIYPTKVDCPPELEFPNLSFKMRINIFPVLEIDNGTHNELPEKNTYVHLSGDFIRFLPAIHVGSTYEMTYNRNPEFWLKNFDNARIKSLQIEVNKNFEYSTYKDLIGHKFGPTILQLNEENKQTYIAREMKFLESNKILNISDLLYGDMKVGSIISIQGVLVSKEFRPTVHLPKFTRSPSFSNHLKGDAGHRDTSLLLRIRDTKTKDVIDTYIVSTARYIIPLGLIPGQPLILRKVIAKVSKIGIVYCCSLPTTNITLAGIPNDDRKMHHELDNIKLIDLFNRSAQKLCRIHCTITQIFNLSVEMICETCEQTFYDNSCPNGCTLFPPKFHVEGKFEVRDGTSKAIVLIKDEAGLQELLQLKDDRIQLIRKAAAQKKIVYHFNFNKNFDKLFNQVRAKIPICREIILYCWPIKRQSLKNNNFSIQTFHGIELKAAGIEEIIPESEAFNYLQNFKKKLNV
ncbi:7676_t:CDS:1 [Diversispora eburnea]|uniref:CST complex subunit CTC1 n=1 Tax=Diversispora eburnea TaxID=1213867 RepID=A0A9N8Z8G6_9GLOM|nr:7676_t:CDS:1 [Diversispora eburnea]